MGSISREAAQPTSVATASKPAEVPAASISKAASSYTPSGPPPEYSSHCASASTPPIADSLGSSRLAPEPPLIGAVSPAFTGILTRTSRLQLENAANASRAGITVDMPYPRHYWGHPAVAMHETAAQPRQTRTEKTFDRSCVCCMLSGTQYVIILIVATGMVLLAFGSWTPETLIEEFFEES